MASIQGQFSNSQWVGTKIDFYEQNVSVENNTSEVKVDLYFLSLNGGSGSFDGVRNAVINVDGQEKTIPVNGWYVEVGQTVYIGSTIFTIPHNEDGSKTVNLTSNYDTNYGPIGSSNLSGSLKLETIARASKVTCPDANIGSSTTISIQRAFAEFTHTITYEFEGLTGTIKTKTKDVSFGWTIPTSFYAKIPNSTYGMCTLTCKTYKGTKLIGSTTYVFKVSVDADINKPTVSVSILDSNAKTKALTGNENILVKYFSNANYTINATASHNATIKSYRIDCSDGKSDIISTGTINAVESPIFNVTVTDSRDISKNVLKTLTMVDYIKLGFKNVTFERLEPTSNTVAVTYEGIYYNGSFTAVNNTLQVKYRYREANGTWSSYVNLSPNIESNTFKQSKTNLTQEFSYQKQYQFEIVAIDKIYDMSSEDLTVKISKTVTKGIPLYGEGEDKVVYFCDVYFDKSIFLKDVNINSLIKVNMATAYLENDTLSISTENYWYTKKIALEKIRTNTTNFTFSSGGIEIESDMAKVLVSANLVNVTIGNGDVVINKRTTDEKGNTITVELATCPMGCSGTCNEPIGYSISPKICEVKKGDIIFLNVCPADKVSSKTVQGLGRTYLTVIELKE